MLKGVKVITLDFDGVLVDSYSIIPRIYREIGELYLDMRDGKIERFVKDMLQGEELLDLGILGPRRYWWPTIIKNYVNGKPLDLKEIERYYWERRIAGTKLIEGVAEALDQLSERGYRLYILCSRDDKDGLKMDRIKATGVDKYFKDIFLVGENVESRVKAIDIIAEREGVERSNVLVVDDKVPPLYEVRGTGVRIAKVDFDGPIRLAWNLPIKPDLRVKRIVELLDFLP